MDEGPGGDERPLLLAGSMGPERLPVRPDPDDPHWFEPLHVRDEAAARDRIAAQVAAGADAVLAPSWLTHRHALLPLGETRQAGAWTAAAVRVARDGIEAGLERRETAAEQPEPDEGDEDGATSAAAAADRPAPLVGAVLPALDEMVEGATGQLLPQEAATVRDYRDQAGLLADADPDFILVEGPRTEEGLRVAIQEATATGLPVWVAHTTERPPDVSRTQTSPPSREALGRWAEIADDAGATRLLLPPPVEPSAGIGESTGMTWGGLVSARPGRPAASDLEALTQAAHAWLEAGATAVAILDGASVPVVAALRTGMDRSEGVRLAAAAARRSRWSAHIAVAASMAEGGPAAWLGRAPEEPLPAGFVWLVAEPEEWRRLPVARYRLVVEADRTGAALEQLAAVLDEHGMLARREAGAPRAVDGLRLLLVDDEEEPALTLYRRETSG